MLIFTRKSYTTSEDLKDDGEDEHVITIKAMFDWHD